jgi:hypothetical protein
VESRAADGGRGRPKPDRGLEEAENRSLVKITPAHLELLSQQLSSEEAAGVTKTFVIGGEACWRKIWFCGENSLQRRA